MNPPTIGRVHEIKRTLDLLGPSPENPALIDSGLQDARDVILHLDRRMTLRSHIRLSNLGVFHDVRDLRSSLASRTKRGGIEPSADQRELPGRIALQIILHELVGRIRLRARDEVTGFSLISLGIRSGCLCAQPTPTIVTRPAVIRSRIANTDLTYPILVPDSFKFKFD